MIEGQELSGMIRRAEAYFKDRPHMPAKLSRIKQNPQIAGDTLYAVNLAAEKLNEFIMLSDEIAEPQGEFLTNCFRVRSVNNGKRIRTPSDLLGLSRIRSSSNDYKECGKTFEEVTTRMVRAEQGEKSEMIRAHLDNLSIEEFTDIMGIFFYSIRSLVSNKSLNYYGHNLTYAIVEMLALNGFETRTFASIKEIISDESISPMMRKIIDDDVDDLYNPEAVLRETPNFEVKTELLDGKQKGFLIVPKSAKANTMLISATANPFTNRLVRSQPRKEGLPELQFVAAGEFNVRNLRLVLGGSYNQFQNGQTILPSIERMETQIAQGLLRYPRS